MTKVNTEQEGAFLSSLSKGEGKREASAVVGMKPGSSSASLPARYGIGKEWLGPALLLSYSPGITNEA